MIFSKLQNTEGRTFCKAPLYLPHSSTRATLMTCMGFPLSRVETLFLLGSLGGKQSCVSILDNHNPSFVLCCCPVHSWLPSLMERIEVRLSEQCQRHRVLLPRIPANLLVHLSGPQEQRLPGCSYCHMANRGSRGGQKHGQKEPESGVSRLREGNSGAGFSTNNCIRLEYKTVV